MFWGLKDLENMAPEGRKHNKKLLIKAEEKMTHAVKRWKFDNTIIYNNMENKVCIMNLSLWLNSFRDI